ncbi:MAG TPA: HDOD domain-containing protein [Polyangiaceae bacterium]|nr:HDOD domain-containing protein [Polyangiaceae bacterium]
MSPDDLGKRLDEQVARGDFQVPPYPAVALKLQRIFARENYGVGEIADTIAADPALAARILGLANTALYRASEEITTLPRAVNRLGARVVSALALAAGVGGSAMHPGVLFDVKYRVWRRSVTAALACQKLAPLRGLDANEAFLVGLIHGLGRSVAVAALEALVLREKNVPPLMLLQWLAVAEGRRQPLALAVAERWQLPGEILAPLRPGAESTPMGALVLEAERIAGDLESSYRPEASSPAEARAVDELVQSLPQVLDALAAVPPPPPGRPAPSLVASAIPILKGERRVCQLAITDCKKTPAKLKPLTLTATGLEAQSSLPFQDGSVVRLAVGTGSARLEAWFNVLACVHTGSHYHLEAELLSPPREVKERWQALFDHSAP